MISQHAAKHLNGRGQLPTGGLPKPSGDRAAGARAMTINGRWRLVFRFNDGGAHAVESVGAHQRPGTVILNR